MLDIVPRNGRKVYDMRDVIDVVFDEGSSFEVQPEFGRSMVCTLARLGGHPVAVIANQPRVIAGSIDVDGADKAAHFITVADSFHLPLVFFADNPGVLPGTASERRGILRSGARMYAAQTIATTPKFEVTFRKAYGFGSMVMGMIPFDGQSAVFAFPGATMGAMGAAAMGRSTGADEDEAERLRLARARGVVRVGEQLRFRRLDRSPRDPQRAAPLARACAVPPAGAGRTGRAHRHHAMTHRDAPVPAPDAGHGCAARRRPGPRPVAGRVGSDLWARARRPGRRRGEGRARRRRHHPHARASASARCR